MIVTEEVGDSLLADLIKRVQAGDEVLLTQGDKPVAKIISASTNDELSSTTLNFGSFKNRRVLTPFISQGELGEEMFGR